MENKKFWQSSNFWMSVVLAIGGLWVGFPEGDARDTVAALFALFSAAGLLRNKLKNLQIDWKQWIANKNTWNYLAAAFTAILPNIPLDLFDRLQDLANAAIGGNWQGILTALFSIGTMIYFIATGNRSMKPAK